MFDIGFWEIALIAVVALLVIGPERLPALARNIGFWIGKVRKFVSSVQEDFQREVVKAEELKHLLEQQSKIKDMHEIIEKTVDDTRKTVPIGADILPADPQESGEVDHDVPQKEKPAKQSKIDSRDESKPQDEKH